MDDYRLFFTCIIASFHRQRMNMHFSSEAASFSVSAYISCTIQPLRCILLPLPSHRSHAPAFTAIVTGMGTGLVVIISGSEDGIDIGIGIGIGADRIPLLGRRLWAGNRIRRMRRGAVETTGEDAASSLTLPNPLWCVHRAVMSASVCIWKCPFHCSHRGWECCCPEHRLGGRNIAALNGHSWQQDLGTLLPSGQGTQHPPLITFIYFPSSNFIPSPSGHRSAS